MKANAQIHARLAELLAGGFLPKSECSASLLRYLRPLLESGVVREERSGAGRRLVVQEATALQSFLEARFPAAAASGLSNRVAGVARFRDSKVLSADTPPVVQLRVTDRESLWRDGAAIAASSATEEHGVFSFVLTGQSRYEIRGACAVVENPALFQMFGRLGLAEMGIVLYAGGRLPNSVLRWLAGMDHPAFQATHFPDYDPVGLSEYLRLRKSLGSRVSLHLPANLDAAFARFSNPKLLQHTMSQSLVRALRKSSVPEVQRVLSLMDRNNAGLEQEALLVG